jgi:hypothetical protein
MKLLGLRNNANGFYVAISVYLLIRTWTAKIRYFKSNSIS